MLVGTGVSLSAIVMLTFSPILKGGYRLAEPRDIRPSGEDSSPCHRLASGRCSAVGMQNHLRLRLSKKSHPRGVAFLLANNCNFDTNINKKRFSDKQIFLSFLLQNSMQDCASVLKPFLSRSLPFLHKKTLWEHFLRLGDHAPCVLGNQEELCGDIHRD